MEQTKRQIEGEMETWRDREIERLIYGEMERPIDGEMET